MGGLGGALPHASGVTKSAAGQWPSLAVVMPVLDEETWVGAALASLAGQTSLADRVLVADGGSTDDTVSVCRAMEVEVLDCSCVGRGPQIAQALGQVEEEVVLVAHGDMCFPPEALAAVRQRLGSDPGVPGGCLGHRFDGGGWPLRLVERWDRIRAGRWGISYGDQAQFFRRRLLDRMGGFPTLPIMEDLELCRRLMALGRPVYLDMPVLVSARRFQRLGYLRTVWTNHRLRRAFRRGGAAACGEILQRYQEGPARGPLERAAGGRLP